MGFEIKRLQALIIIDAFRLVHVVLAWVTIMMH